MLKKKDHKNLWKRIKKYLPSNKKSTIISSLKTKSGEAEDSTSIANELNHHFSTIGQTLADSLLHSPTNKPKINKPKTSLSEIPEVTWEVVLDMLKKYPNHKPTGITGISTRLIKMATPAIASILAQMINKCISIRDIPESWKSATVTPIHKGGNRKDRHNYRPISVLPFIAKFLEAVINKQFQYHLIDNEIIHRSQAGFVPKRTLMNASLT